MANIISKNSIKEVLKEKGCMVGAEALEEFYQKMYNILEKKAELVAEVTKNANRKIVKKEDVEIAFKC